MAAAEHRRPPIAALFLVVFDQKVGYTLAWHREEPDVSLDGVEFQSLPSGLHGVKEDLVYFVHGDYAGVSAFVQGEADEAHRNAAFVSVGVLLPLGDTRLGRGWLLADELRKLARQIVPDVQQSDILLQYWDAAPKPDVADPRESAPRPSHPRQDSVTTDWVRRSQRQRNTQMSMELMREDYLPADHPSAAIPEFFDFFGPLLFPLYRAALLRRRILFLGNPPVQRNCNAVYILSVLASIPSDSVDDLSDEVPPVPESMEWLKPLFSVGMHDIPRLAEMQKDRGWLACTTDGILRDKSQLYDVFVELPPPSLDGVKRWPTLRTSEGETIKATQRDIRRYKILRAELRRMRFESRNYETDDTNSPHQPSGEEDSDDERQALLDRTTSVFHVPDDTDELDIADIAEPMTWSALAYNGFMWWSAADEVQRLEDTELEADRSLLDELPDIHISEPAQSDSDESDDSRERQHRNKAQATATVVVAYFLRLTAQFLRTLAEIADESTDDSADAAETDDNIVVNGKHLAVLGLDVWSPADKAFVVKAIKAYLDRDAVIEGGGVTICGVKLC